MLRTFSRERFLGEPYIKDPPKASAFMVRIGSGGSIVVHLYSGAVTEEYVFRTMQTHT